MMMKSVKYLFSIVLLMILFITLTSCGKEQSKIKVSDVPQTFEFIQSDESTKKEGYVLVGLLSASKSTLNNYPSGQYYELFQGGLIEVGEYYPVYIEESQVTTAYSYPEVELKGLNFSGYYNQDAKRITNKGLDEKVYIRYIDFAQAGLIVFVCIAIVFTILAILAFIVSGFKLVSPKAKKAPIPEATKFTMESITDPDMMVAALVATIDYHDETKKDVRLVSIKQIN